jgi:hypothetical protein
MATIGTPERTREHYIAALSVNHVERFVVRQGHVAERPGQDYGYDLIVTTFDYRRDSMFRHGYIENGHILFQLKATDDLKVSIRDGKTISLRISRRHAALWAIEPMPVILVLYEVAADTAYWLHMQPYLQNYSADPSSGPGITVHLSRDAVLDEKAVETFRRYKEDALQKFTGVHRHAEHLD